VILIYSVYRSSFFKTLQREESIYRIEFEGPAKHPFELMPTRLVESDFAQGAAGVRASPQLSPYA
jgi:hypothetical protein